MIVPDVLRERPDSEAMPHAIRERWSDEVVLAPVATAAGCCRLFASFISRQWRVPPEHADAAQLLASELVTNAINAASRGRAESALEPHVFDRHNPITVRMTLLARSLLIEVWDNSPEPPTAKAAGEEAESGRGLLIVETLSKRWGYYYPRRGGKVTWCEHDLGYQARAAAADAWRSLPKRHAANWPLRPADYDPELLARVLKGLIALQDDAAHGSAAPGTAGTEWPGLTTRCDCP